MTAAKMRAIGDFLTNREIQQALNIYRDDPDTFHGRFRDQVIIPNLDRINSSLGQANNPDYLAYAVEAAMIFSTQTTEDGNG